MNDPLGYDVDEEIIKDGSILQDFKKSHYWPVVKELMESEIRACFRGFVSQVKMGQDKEGNPIEVSLSEDDLKEMRASAMGVMRVFEMIDGKISDMEIWIAQQQKESEKDIVKVDELFTHHRNRMNNQQELV